MNRRLKLSEEGVKRRDEILRQIGIRPEEVRRFTLDFEPGGVVTMDVERLVLPRDDANELLALVVDAPEANDD